MMRSKKESLLKKNRKCWHCAGRFKTTAAEIKDHAEVCSRTKDLFRDKPSVNKNDSPIVMPTDAEVIKHG